MKPKVRGFALVLVLALLALLVLAIYALGVATRIGTQIAASGEYQVQARQHALLAFDVALGELQRFAGTDDIRTGMAGVVGVPAGSGNAARHWCGVWDTAGGFRRWLASGAEGAFIPPLNDPAGIEIVGAGALGADATDKEHVRVLMVPVEIADRSGTMRRQGRYGWWVGDEGVKLSAVLPATGTPVPGGKHAIDELIPALSPDAANLDRAETYAQLALVPTPALTPGQLQANFHALTRTHAGPDHTGRLNVNTTCARFWRGIAATYNRAKAADAPALTPAGFGQEMADPGMGPWPGVGDFLASAGLAAALAHNGGVKPEEFAAAMAPWLATRSDTFRIRAYGDAVNRVDPDRVEAAAWCEAIVERSAGPLPGFGRRFVVTYFRWLGPDDL
jgi:hypothetical protein